MRSAFAVVAISTAVWSTSPGRQQGMGANVTAGDAMSLLRSGPLTRTPGELLNEIGVNVPMTFPQELIPDGASVGVVSVAPSMTVVVSVVKAGAGFERFRYTSALEEKGWINPTRPRTGFVSTGTPQLALCRGSDFVTLIFRSSSNGDRLLRAALSKEPTRSCVPVGLPWRSNWVDVPIPALELPVGVNPASAIGGGGGVDDTYSQARLETTMTPAALAAHLTPQMASAGWKIEGSPIGDVGISVTRFVTLSRAGESVTALLILTRLGETPYLDAMLRVVRQKPVIR